MIIIMNLKQMEIKLKPMKKLNHNIYAPARMPQA